MYVLDTNIIVHLFKGAYDLASKVQEVGLANCYISEITVAELMYGIEKGAERYRRENREQFNNMLYAFEGRILPIRDCFQVYATQKTELRKMGKPIGEFDLLIGSTAVASNFILVSENVKDFENLIRIQLENWVIRNA